MRKSSCSNFTSNDNFLDLTSLKISVFGGMHLQGVYIKTVNDALQATAVTVLEKKRGSGFCCLPQWEARAWPPPFCWRVEKALGRALATGC